MASPCKLSLPLIRALFFRCWFLISKQKARALPSLQQCKAEFKAVGSFGGGEGKSETVFGEGGADSRNGHQVSSMPLSSMHEERFVCHCHLSLCRNRLLAPTGFTVILSPPSGVPAFVDCL